MALRNSFKHFRRDDVPISTFQPHSRKCTSTDREFSQSSDAEMITPDQKVGDLCTEWKKDARRETKVPLNC